MMNHIDISSVLRQTLACDLYSNLVTRSTGAAVRGQIEQMVSESSARALTIIDFSQVSMIDFSCADEVVAKLLMRYAVEDPPQDAYFLFRGVTEHHSDAIEAVLLRHGLALVLETDDGGNVEVMGVITDDDRRAWDMIYQSGPLDANALGTALGTDGESAQTTLDSLCRLRLVMRVDGEYLAVGCPRG